MVKLSIIIPYYNTYTLTNKLLKELISQVTDEVEVILVDDGCNEERLDKFNINIIHLEENQGGAHASNVGIKEAHGKYIAFIDSDDMVANDYVETLLKTIDERDEDLIYMNWYDVNTGETVVHPSNYAPWKCIYKKDIIPFFREKYKYSYDVPFQEELNKKDLSRYYIEDKVLYYYNSNRAGSLMWEKKLLDKNNIIKVEVTDRFTLDKFSEISNLVRKNPQNDEDGTLYVGDTFCCDKEMTKYLTGENDYNKAFVKYIEIKNKEE